ncbi:hypothetical protein POTOM_042889 [Populus tomentosa]|uniref:Uncharacterized protein n=1 Tax=Populus tomentosa TaxID=118781 RepID=A0A8X7YKN4_POPTO|nr:hypothetical protein POTOM_042889 [Populus tomentosa]
MQERGLVADDFIFSFLLKVCGQLGSVLLGRQMHCSTLNMGLIMSLLGTLLFMYMKCSRILKHHGSVIIEVNNSLLVIHGFANDALVLFSMLEQKPWVPDDITVLVVFVVAAMEGYEGRRFFDVVKKEHHIQPTIKPGGCMVDILGRAGFVKKAYR